MRTIERRIHALESRLITGKVVLYFADGSTSELYGRGDFVLRLFHAGLAAPDASANYATELDLVRRSVDAREPDGGHMIELLRALMNSPAGPPSDLEEAHQKGGG